MAPKTTRKFPKDHTTSLVEIPNQLHAGAFIRAKRLGVTLKKWYSEALIRVLNEPELKGPIVFREVTATEEQLNRLGYMVVYDETTELFYVTTFPRGGIGYPLRTKIYARALNDAIEWAVKRVVEIEAKKLKNRGRPPAKDADIEEFLKAKHCVLRATGDKSLPYMLDDPMKTNPVPIREFSYSAALITAWRLVSV